MQGIHRPTPYSQHGIAPRLFARALNIAQGDIHTTDKTHLTIDDNDLAVVTIIHLTRKRREPYGHKRAHFDTFFTHALKKTVLDIPTSHIVVDQSHFYALTRLVDQGIGNQFAQSIISYDIHINMDMVLGQTDISKQMMNKLISIGKDIHLVILKWQGEILIDKKVYQGLVLLGQLQVLLFCKLQHRALGKLVHGTIADVTFLTGVDTKKQVENDAHHRHKVDHHRPGHRLGWLTIVENHMNHGQDDNDLVNDIYDIQPTHRPSFFATSLYIPSISRYSFITAI